MQMNDLQELVSKLKQNNDMQVETTTLGRFLGTESSRAAVYLGKEFLNRPVIVSTTEGKVQILDLHTGLVAVLDSMDEALPKLIASFSEVKEERPKRVASAKSNKEVYEKVVKKEVHNSAISQRLCEFRETIQKPASVEDRLTLVEKTIKVLEEHKCTCGNGETEKVDKAQSKLTKLMTHARSKRLAPGQIPSVYELAVWCWVN